MSEATGTPATPYIIGLGGTTRAFSSTEKALRFALFAAETEGATSRGFFGADLVRLPIYAPESTSRNAAAVELIGELRRADGIILASPGYHGGVSGMVKNAIDYIEDMRDDPRPYLSGLPVGCVATGAGWQGTVTTLEQLRTIVHSLRGWATPLGAGINTVGMDIFDGNDVVDERARFQLATVASEVVEFARLRVFADSLLA